MRWSWAWAAFCLGFVACGRDWDAFSVEGSDAGGGTGGVGGNGVDGGSCFPGSKACPDPKTGEPKCLTADAPAVGCQSSSSCEPCTAPHATSKCSSGKCAIDTCASGYADCDNGPIDGCEVALATDPTHCGGCNNDCIASKGPGWICQSGQCVVNDCSPPTTGDCDGNKTNGCEVDLLTDVANCGYCGHACSVAHATSGCKATTSGSLIADCYLVSCDANFANCDGNDANGCETNVGSDAGNCGACGKACIGTNGVPACSGGQCSILCNSGFGNCDNNANNGCEASLNSDPTNCGGCGLKCAPLNVNNPTCASGACSFDSCKSGFANCDGTKPNGCEINTQTDPNNCGSCGNKCNGTCTGGSCGAVCSPPKSLCGATCVDTTTDKNHCGSCTTVCSNPSNGIATCTSGTCVTSCNSGFHLCSNNQCYASTDAQHCGTACTSCSGPTSGTGSPSCVTGACGIACSAPTPTLCGTGCYDTQTDKYNCGNCGFACPGAKVCQGGMCL